MLKWQDESESRERHDYKTHPAQIAMIMGWSWGRLEQLDWSEYRGLSDKYQ